jgi:hypothetical protein
LTAVTGLVLMASASGCCCDWCNWSCCKPCNPCGGGCSPTGCPPGGAYLNSGATTTSALPATYYGAPVATAAVPIESLPTY